MANTFTRGEIRNDEATYCPFCASANLTTAMTREELEEEGIDPDMFEGDIYLEDYLSCQNCNEVFHVV